MFKRRKSQENPTWLRLPKAEAEAPVIALDVDEDGVIHLRSIGRRYLIGNYIVIEFADALHAAEHFADMTDIDHEVLRGE